MKAGLFEDMRQRAGRKAAVHRTVANRDRDFEVAIGGMEVRRRVIAVQDRDGDSEEAADDGHDANLSCTVTQASPRLRRVGANPQFR